jgi:hypothetical protein
MVNIQHECSVNTSDILRQDQEAASHVLNGQASMLKALYLVVVSRYAISLYSDFGGIWFDTAQIRYLTSPCTYELGWDLHGSFLFRKDVGLLQQFVPGFDFEEPFYQPIKLFH